MKLRPLGEKIIVTRVAAEEKTKGGIVLPDAAKEKPQEGKVLAVGEGRLTEDGQRQKLTVKKGDRVLFTNYAGNEIKVGGQEYLIMTEDDVLAVVQL
ncbi:MAG: co-chaperone GroES [Planctomycetes bacterium]|nr:co-chaperone GroES [Planctomycetota bacterium]MCK5578856.1 co-chaperone GroES [Planctomycetota bacterium]